MKEQLALLNATNLNQGQKLTEASEAVNQQKKTLEAEKARIESREQELVDVAAAVAVTLTREKENLRNRVQKLDEQRTTLSTQVNDLIEERQELTRLVAELSGVKGQLETLSAGISELQARSEKLDAVAVKNGAEQ